MAQDFPLVDDGIWCEPKAHAAPARFAGRPALFLDRDGVVVEEVAYLHRPQDAVLIDGAAAAVAAANAREVAVVLVTNQSGIGRGYYGWADFLATQAAIEAELAAAGARLDMVLACPYTPHGSGPYVHPDHPDRKPNPGMLRRALAALEADPANSWLLGDRALDVRAARAAGIAGALHVATGYGADPAEQAAALAEAAPSFTVHAARSIADATALPARMAPADAARAPRRSGD